MRTFFSSLAILLALALFPQAQGTAPVPPLTIVTRDARRPVPTIIVNGQELIALDDVATLFQATVRVDTLANAITIGYKGKSVILSSEQPMASVGGRVVPLPAPARQAGRRWFVPIEFLSAGLAPIYDARIELRRGSRLVLLGDVRVPRLTARVDSTGPPTRATIDISPATPVTIAIEAGRVTIRIDADGLDATLPPAGAGLIDGFRSDTPTSVAVLVSPRGAARATQAAADGITRVTVDVSNPAAQTEVAPPSPAPPAAVEALPPIAVARPAIQAIAIDPGHGGNDAGAHGAGGTAEKVVTLDIAKRLRMLIETRLGVRVILTREDDRAVGLDERAAIANNGKADLFLSLHMNAAFTSNVAGAEVFALRLTREAQDVRLQATAQEVTLPVLGGGTRPIDIIPWDLAQVRHVDASAAFAGKLEEQLRKHVPMGPRPLRQAPMRVLGAVNMPAALVEMAYLTNAAQERAFQSADFPTTVAQALFDAIVSFRDTLVDRP